MKKRLAGVLSFILAFTFVVCVGCGDKNPQKQQPSPSLTLSKTEESVYTGETATITYELLNSEEAVTLRGSDASLASYEDNSGTVTITTKASGTYVLTVSAGKLEERLVLTIIDPPAIALSENLGSAQIGEEIFFSYELQHFTTTPSVTVTANSDKVTVTENGGKVTLSASEVGEYKITVKAGDVEVVYTFTATHIPEIALSKKFDSVRYGDTYTLEYSAKFLDDDVTITASDSEIADFSEADGKVTITTDKAEGGDYVLTFRAGDVKAKFTLTIVAYTVYDPAGDKIATFGGFYKALDELYSDVLANGTAKGSKIKNQYGNVVFENTAKYANALIDTEGCYEGKDGQYADGAGKVEGGRFNWWTYNYGPTNLDVYNSPEFDYITTSDANDIRFVSRRTDWEACGTDWSGAVNGEPSDIWQGWRVSSYKPGLSVVEFNGWADSQSNGTGSANIDCYEMTYDLSESVMKPSQNNNMTTRGDMWIGESNLVSDSNGVSYIMGITFDAGNEESTRDLENGDTRSFYLFKEQFLLEGSGKQGERTLGDSIGTATWNKEEGVWEFADSVTIKLVYTDNGDGTWLWTFTATVGEEVKTMTHTFNAAAGSNTFRLIYGINYTPELKDGRCVPDMENGGYWLNVVQTDATCSVVDGDFTRNIGFLSSRLINRARFIAVYGCDVASITPLGDPLKIPVTEGEAISYEKARIDFNYTARENVEEE